MEKNEKLDAIIKVAQKLKTIELCPIDIQRLSAIQHALEYLSKECVELRD